MKGIRKLRIIKIESFSIVQTLFSRILAKWFWGIKIQGGSRFYGKTIFYRTKNSEITIGKNCRFISKANSINLIGINRPCILNTLTKQAKLSIGDNCGFSGTVIGAAIEIIIGDNVKCGANTLITDSDWHFEDSRSGKPKKIIIGNNVWLGVNSVILKGVEIGENAVVGANSVVTRNVPANSVVAGNPCKIIKEGAN